MRHLVIAALALVAVCVIAGSALAASGSRSSVIYDSTSPNGAPTNEPSYGPEAYAFKSIGDKITFDGTARGLTNVTVTLSSWACQQGSWVDKNCVTKAGATFAQPITLAIWNADHTNQLATSTKTFDVPYRPSASAKCTGADAGKWYTPAKQCRNGITDDVTFNFSNVTLPQTVQYEISYNTSTAGPNPLHVAGPYDSLNVAVTDKSPSAGTTSDANIWIDGNPNPAFGLYTPAVQFKAGNGS
jgi:hypothetical protein